MNVNRLGRAVGGYAGALAISVLIGQAAVATPSALGRARVSAAKPSCGQAVLVASAAAYQSLTEGQRLRARRDRTTIARAARRRQSAHARSLIRLAKAELRQLEHQLACEERSAPTESAQTGLPGPVSIVSGPPALSAPGTTPSAPPKTPKAPVLTPTPKPPVGEPSEKKTVEGSLPPFESAETPETPLEVEAPVVPVEVPTVLKTSEKLSISVRGNQLVNGSGQVVTLHGVDISGTEWQCLYGQAFYGPSNEASIAAMVAWHVNAVRIPLNEDCWLGINGAPKDIAAYHEEIQSYVNRLHAHGIYAILDLHWNAPGSTLSHLGRGFAGFYEMADGSHSPAFWSSVASYFKEDHAVLFDLFNEPVNISWSCWLNGCMAPRGYQTAGMQQLVDAVREAGATQPVMLGGLEWGSQLGHSWLTNLPNDPAGQLVASVHVYNQNSVSYFNANLGGVAAKYPVVAGEIGETDCGDTDIDAFMPWADAHGVSYVAWAWFVGSCSSYPSLISNYSGAPTSFGVGYRNHLLEAFPAP
jgi:endoglucanase